MRNLLAFLAALILVLGGLGLYLGWFKIQTSPGPDGHTTINIDFNGKKVTQDAAEGISKLNDFTKSLADKQKKEQDDKEKEKATSEQQPPVVKPLEGAGEQ